METGLLGPRVVLVPRYVAAESRTSQEPALIRHPLTAVTPVKGRRLNLKLATRSPVPVSTSVTIAPIILG